MSNQPEALRLAEWFEGGLGGCELEAAAELRRLHAEHEEDQGVIAVWRGRTLRAEAQRDALLEACRAIVQAFDALPSGDSARMARLQINAARAAIAKAEGEKA